MRTGDNVVVPTRRSWIRCGSSEPVTKTSRSETFSSFKVWPAGVPASEEVTDRRNRDAITNNIGAFTATKYTERVSCAISITLPNCTRSAAEDGGSYNHEFKRSTGSLWRAEAELGLQVSPEPIYEPVLLDRSIFSGGQRFRFVHVVV